MIRATWAEDLAKNGLPSGVRVCYRCGKAFSLFNPDDAKAWAEHNCEAN